MFPARTDSLQAAGLGESEHALRRLERSVAAVAADLDKTGRVVQFQLEQLEHLGRRLEDVAGLAAQPPQPDLAPIEDELQRLESTRASQTDAISRLGSAVEAQSKATAKVATAVSQLGSQLESRLNALEQGTTVGPGEAEMAEILDRLQALSDQTQMLRRRIALRARTDQGIDPALVDAVADAVAERLFVDRAEDVPAATGRRRGRRA
jgi:uncharacterized coiled-coil protein SlyX